MADRRSNLRIATMPAHERLDAVVNRARFFDSREGYATYLIATWQARSQAETELCASAGEFFRLWPLHQIAWALHLDIEDVTGLGSFLPGRTEDNCRFDTVGKFLGALYVLEGSALGARVLSTRAASLGMRRDFGARHFALQTSRPMAWSNFLAVLEATPLDAVQEQDCLTAAMKMFIQFERAYTEVG